MMQLLLTLGLVWWSFIVDVRAVNSDGDVRLVDGNLPLSGRVEVYHDGKWGTVCNYLFGFDEAMAVCGTLGSPTGNVAEFGPGTGKIWIDHLDCPEDSHHFENCSYHGWNSEDCSHDDDVGVICQDIRLVNSTSSLEGHVEIFHDDRWGTVCSESFGDAEATAVCQSLGYINGEASQLGEFEASTTTTIWLDDFDCDANATNIYDCDHQGWANNTCNHDLDIGVRCMDIKLVDGDSTMSGRVEIHVGGQAGGICLSSFTDQDAVVICQTLGAAHGKARYYDEGALPVWISEMNCSNAADVSQCRYDVDVDTDCQYSAGVECSPVRLVSEQAPIAGRVEVYHKGTWGSVCEDHVTWRQAHLMCKTMGMQGGVVESFGPGTGQIWLDDVQCSPNATSIVECEHNEWGVNDCTHEEDLGIRCLPIRLFGGDTENTGWLQVYHEGTWGTVCNEGFDESSVNMICELLYWFNGGSVDTTYGAGEGSIWFDKLDCSDEPLHFEDCSHGDWGDHQCSHNQDIAITCH